MNERELSRALHDTPVPDESAAAERAWEIVHGAFESRERVRWTRRHRGPVIALVAAGALLVAAFTPPGQAVVDRFRDAVGREPSEPALVRLPAPGRLLVVSDGGPWVVQEDGSKRLLGDYDDASWSPLGRYVVATQGQHLVALDPENGDVRWSLARSAPLKDPRWSGGGLDTRIAYRAGSSLHVVAGDGSPDEVIAENAAPVAPAWKPDSHVLAYASLDSRVRVVDADAGNGLWTTSRIAGIRSLAFYGDRLVVATRTEVLVLRPHKRFRFLKVSPGHVLLDAIVLRYGGVVYADYDPRTDTTVLFRSDCTVKRVCALMPDKRMLQGPGQIENLTVSPDGRWLVAGWEAADQLLFFRLLPRIGKVVSVADATREFSPGTPAAAFPRLAGWSPITP